VVGFASVKRSFVRGKCGGRKPGSIGQSSLEPNQFRKKTGRRIAKWAASVGEGGGGKKKCVGGGTFMQTPTAQDS